MKKLITKIGGPGIFWICTLIVAIIVIAIMLTGNDGGAGHGHTH